MIDKSWRKFRQVHDLLELSHRGLQRQLIPEWLRTSADLSDRIESSAYGETPPSVVELVLDALEIELDDVFLDLGCGGANVTARALARGAVVLAIERNPELAAAARSFLPNLCQTRLQLRCADFLETDWGHAEVAYTVSARYPAAVTEQLARKVHQTSTLRAVACLGRPLPLPPEWSQRSLGQHAFAWNPGEQILSEPLFLYRRNSRA